MNNLLNYLLSELSKRIQQDKYDLKIIKKYQTKLEYMLDNHSKVLQKRFDLHYPKDNTNLPENSDIYRFTNNYIRDLNRNNPLPKQGKIRSSGRLNQEKKLLNNSDINENIDDNNNQYSKTPSKNYNRMDVQFLAVREQTSEDKHPHFHCLVLVNGHAKKDSYYLQSKADHHWNNILGFPDNSGLVHNPNQTKSDYVFIDKSQDNFEIKIKESLTQAQYLAKNKTKDLNPQGSWRCTGNRLPKSQPRKFEK
jgi:hypothetical protein